MGYPSKYNVITQKIVTYGWRCASCSIPTKRYKEEANRDAALKAHHDEFHPKPSSSR